MVCSIYRIHRNRDTTCWYILCIHACICLYPSLIKTPKVDMICICYAIISVDTQGNVTHVQNDVYNRLGLNGSGDHDGFRYSFQFSIGRPENCNDVEIFRVGGCSICFLFSINLKQQISILRLLMDARLASQCYNDQKLRSYNIIEF